MKLATGVPTYEDPIVPDEAKIGALELVELGNARQMAFDSRRKMIGNGPARLGQLPNIFGFFNGVVLEGVSKLTGLFADILEIPLDLISSGVGEVIGAFAGIVGEIPVIGEIAAAVLLAAKAIIQFALELPVEILRWVENMTSAFKTLKPEEQTQFTQAAIALLVDAAPPEHKAAVAQKLAQTPPIGETPGEADGFPAAEVAAVALNALAIGAFAVL